MLNLQPHKRGEHFPTVLPSLYYEKPNERIKLFKYNVYYYKTLNLRLYQLCSPKINGNLSILSWRTIFTTYLKADRQIITADTKLESILLCYSF